MLLNELNAEFQHALRRELAPSEQLLWYGQPDVDAIARSLLPYSMIWMSGLFLMSVGMLLDTPGESRNLLTGLIFILVVVAVVGVFELIFVPRRSARTIYVVTDQRAFTMCVTRKLNALDDAERRLLREDQSTPSGFYMANLPSHILLAFAAMDVVHALNHRFDIFLAAGFSLVIVGWTRPWFYEMRLPFAKFRDPARLLYAIDDLFISMEWLPRSEIRQVKLRRLGKDLCSAFLITEKSGCLRFRATSGAGKPDALIQCLSNKSEQKPPGSP
jgi:hypothetical protein